MNVAYVKMLPKPNSNTQLGVGDIEGVNRHTGGRRK